MPLDVPGNLRLPLKRRQELALICTCMCVESIAAVHAYQTSQQVTTSLRSKLYCGSENNSNLTAVMSGLPSSQHAQDLTELCSRYDETLARKARCVEKSSRKEGSSVTPSTSPQCAVKSNLEGGKLAKSQLLPIIGCCQSTTCRIGF